MAKDLGTERRESVLGWSEQEIASETAGALGRSGQKVEQTLSALRAFRGAAGERVRLLKAAVEAVYGFFIQRELLGLTNQEEAIRLYGIPDEVLVRLGAH